MKEFVNDTQLFNQVKEYVDEYFKNYVIGALRSGKDVTGLSHALSSIDGAFKKMEHEFKMKNARPFTDQTV